MGKSAEVLKEFDGDLEKELEHLSCFMGKMSHDEEWYDQFLDRVVSAIHDHEVFSQFSDAELCAIARICVLGIGAAFKWRLEKNVQEHVD